MSHETPEDFPFDEYVPWKPEHDSEDEIDTVQDLFDYVDSLQDFSVEPDFDDGIIFLVDHSFGFTGREPDAGIVRQYNQARHYDATPGRWISDACD